MIYNLCISVLHFLDQRLFQVFFIAEIIADQYGTDTENEDQANKKLELKLNTLVPFYLNH